MAAITLMLLDLAQKIKF